MIAFEQRIHKLVERARAIETWVLLRGPSLAAIDCVASYLRGSMQPAVFAELSRLADNGHDFDAPMRFLLLVLRAAAHTTFTAEILRKYHRDSPAEPLLDVWLFELARTVQFAESMRGIGDALFDRDKGYVAHVARDPEFARHVLEPRLPVSSKDVN